ncbi:hypothetical protein C8R44DRAFT_743088 [Mycena epipterygia]|nr:hypothetical protein C8R44DRAFT_743088 [Mycena epipterygia]
MSALVLRGAPIRLIPRVISSTVFIRSYVLGERRKRGKSRIISTLDPKLLEPGDILDMSHKKTARVHFWGSDIQRGLGALLFYVQIQNGRLPFPPNSRGFLYYHSEAPASPLESSVRFRLAPDNTPSSFLRGQDLLAPCGLPWRISLPQIACRTGQTQFRQQLLHDSLVTEEQLSRCRDIFRHYRDRISPQFTLFRLDSLFSASFSTRICLTTVGDKLHTFTLSPFVEWDNNTSKLYFPWSGSAITRFEASTRAEHAGHRILHLRIVKIMEPVTCTVEGHNVRMLKPEEGELLTVSFRGGMPQPWAYDIDAESKTSVGLRALWDISIARGTPQLTRNL